MSALVLIVESDPLRRARLAAALRAAHYGVAHHDLLAGHPHRPGGPALHDAGRPDLALLDLGAEQAALDALRALKARPTAPPVIALAPPLRPDLRLAALRAGAEEVAERVEEASLPLLLARIRSLLRARLAQAELHLAAPGLAEAPAPFAPRPLPARVALLAPGPGAPGAGFAPHLPGATLLPVPPAAPEPPPADLYVIDATDPADPEGAPAALGLLADLRSRPVSHGVPTLLLLPEGSEGLAAIALDLGAGDAVAGPIPPEEVAARAAALLARKRRADQLRDRLQSRLDAADRDPLTGLHNRRHADPALRAMADQAAQSGRDLALIVLDIDHFKAVNDLHGHPAGDRVLAEVARRLREESRPGDLLARIGGEEFLLALPAATTEGARALAERLRHAVESRPFRLEPARAPEGALFAAAGTAAGAAPLALARAPLAIRVTVSVGVAVGAAARLAAGLSVEDLFARADAALYAAKAGGRNAVAMALGAA